MNSIKGKKSICFIVSSPLTASSFLKKHFEVLSSKFDIYLVANFESFPFLGGEHLKGRFNLKLSRKINLLSDIKCLIRLSWYLKKMNFDAVHSVTPKAGLIGMLSSWFTSTPNRIHIFTGQVWYTRKGVAKAGLVFFDKLIASLATKILVDSSSQRKFLLDQNIISYDRSAVLGKGSISGVDVHRFSPDINLKLRLRKELGFENDELVFGFLGRLTKDKGVFDLVAAFKKLQLKYKHIRLFLIGVDEENIVDRINKSGSNGITFYGHSNEPEYILNALDVFCLPSYREGFGTSVIEASLMELPVICSNTYGLFEAIQNNETGLRYQMGNIDDLSEKMEQLIVDVQLRLRLGRNGSIYVKKYFSAEIISEEWLLFYKMLLE